MERRLNVDTPHFEQHKETREARLQGDERLIGTLLDVNELEDIPKEVGGTQRMEVLSNVSNHFELLLIELWVFFAGKVGCWHVKTRVKMTDMCLSGQLVADMLADMSVTQHKKLSAGVLGQHVTACHLLTCQQHVGNMLALVAGIFAMCPSLGTASLAWSIVVGAPRHCSIGDSQLCFLRFNSNEVNHAPVGWRHSLSPGSPPDFTVEYKQGMVFYL